MLDVLCATSPYDPSGESLRMCGILGIVAPYGRSVSIGRERIVTMRDTMTARGPDAAGLLIRGNIALAHRRLAIRDLGAGTQPIVSDDGQLALVYNGEIYNDDELRSELRQHGVQFRTRCDTETLLVAWQTWGVKCLSKLRGMFAFGVYDFLANRLFLVRDRCGVKPLFFAEADGELVFASTVAAVLQHPHITRQPNWSVVSHYLSTFRTTLGRDTLIRGIRQLRPAECLDWNLQTGQLSVDPYWDFPTPSASDMTFDEAANELDSLLADSTRSRLVSDVPVGMFLSGGVDSSILAANVSNAHGSQLLGSCGGGESDPTSIVGDDDFSAAANCARHTGFDFDEVRVSPETYLDCWSQLVGETALPLTTPSDVIIHQLARRMKRDVGVVLGGEGADELLCGYALPHWSVEDYRLAKLCADGQWPGQPSSERVFLKSLETNYGRSRFDGLVDHYFAANSLVPRSVKPFLLGEDVWQAVDGDEAMTAFYTGEFAAIEESIAALGDSSRSLVHTQSIVLHRLNLESLLGRLDTATMQASLEARVPYTDHRLVEFAFRLPTHFRIDVDPLEESPYLAAAELDRRGSLRPKRLLRAVASRSLPPELAQRRKASFPTPVAAWLSGPWQKWAQDRLLSSPFGQQTFRREAMVELAGNVSAAGMWLWPILNLLAWGDSVFS
ncbi:MAG: asparagine synthase (glutamine-hydrolyzing) [Planctomycetota bacterium]|nr:asparagine synthase (glutamine-hydrolyzing) [Planctomycetota bacterium]